MRYVIAALLSVLCMWMMEPPAYADTSLQLQPLRYQESFAQGERKKGFIDVTNSLAQPVRVGFDVQSFRQADEAGNLVFFEDEQIRQGILLDYDNFEIPAKKTLRLYFVIDSTKLPTGDVFAVLFAKTVPESAGGASPSVRVGSLLLLTNGTPSVHRAEIAKLKLPLLQIGTTLSGSVGVKNTAPQNTANGFFPSVTLHMWPFGSVTKLSGPLIFAGNTRTIAFKEPSNSLGIYKITASYAASHRDQWVILVTGIWRWILISIFALGSLAVGGYFIYRKRKIK